MEVKQGEFLRVKPRGRGCDRDGRAPSPAFNHTRHDGQSAAPASWRWRETRFLHNYLRFLFASSSKRGRLVLRGRLVALGGQGAVFFEIWEKGDFRKV